MKTQTDIKFERVMNDGFHDILKPLGFKKKGNNFYLQRQELGQIINIQKSSMNSKGHIRFTINTGLFIPEYWLAFYNFNNKELPSFPTEPECLIRKRIGQLRNQNDTWYDIEERTNENALVTEMQENLNGYILPYFERISTKGKLIDALDTEEIVLAPLGKLIVYGELKYFEKAKKEYEKLKTERNPNPHFRQTIEEYKTKYRID